MAESVERPKEERGGRYWNLWRVLAAAGIVGVAGGIMTYAIQTQSVRTGGPKVAGGADRAAGGFGSRAGGGAPTEPFNTNDLRVEKDRLLSGGPPKDGIPSLTTAAVQPDDRGNRRFYGEHPPRFTDAEKAGFLDAEARVVGVTVSGERRAYPLAVLNHHEIINDRVGGLPIAVIYCPLCDSVSVLDRRLDGSARELGVSGLLYNSNVVFYDRTDQALWSQVKMQAISGPNAGRSLKHLNGWRITPFADWREAHPDSKVLTFDTGFARRYQRNPYDRYMRSDRLMFPVRPLDDRLDKKDRVVGVRIGGEARAYPIERVRREGRVSDTLGGQKVALTAAGDGGHGVKIAEAPKDARTVHTFWFAWAAFWPESTIYGRE